MIERPLKTEVVEWKENKVTRYLVDQIQRDIEEIKDVWVNGGYSAPDQAATIQLNSKALGGAHALSALLDFIEDELGVEETIEYGH